MDSPGDRGRSSGKDWLRYKGRSRSASNFKNSPFYEKFLFFEKQPSGPVSPSQPSGLVSPSGVTGANARPTRISTEELHVKTNSPSSASAPDSHRRLHGEGSRESTTDTQLRTHPKAQRVRSQPLSVTGSRQPLVVNESTYSGKVPTNKYANRHFAYGRITAEAVQQPVTPLLHTDAVQRPDSSSSFQSHSQSQRIRSHTAVETPPRVAARGTNWPSTADDGEPPSSATTGATRLQLSRAVTRSSQRSEKPSGQDGIDSKAGSTYEIQERTKPASSSFRHISPSSTTTMPEVSSANLSVPYTKSGLIQVTPGGHGLQSRRCLSSSDVFSLPLYIEIGGESRDSPPHATLASSTSQPHSQIPARESLSECSGDVFRSRSTSPGGISDCASREDFDACSWISNTSEQASVISCYSPVSEPLPKTAVSEGDFHPMTKRTSTASIHLIHQGNPQKDVAKESDRKIRVIKVRKPLPYLDSSPRLDEWLSSVMKLQRERKQNEGWAFPEEELGASAQLSLADPSQTQTNEHVKAQSRSLDLPSSRENAASAPRRWSSTGMNTDISLVPQQVISVANDNLGNFVLPNVIQTSARAGNSKAKDANKTSVSDKCCAHCCASHKDLCPHASTAGELSTGDTFTVRHQTGQTYGFGQNLDKYNGETQHLNNSSLPTKQTSVFMSKATQAGSTAENLGPDRHFSKYEPGSDVPVPGPGITIRVTGEDDNFLQSSGKTRLSNEQGRKGAHNAEPGQHGRQSSSEARGASPHYMFPSNHPEDDIMSRLPLSPRNSVGSISSIHSYKSSNADSAVDMGPPDDDQDMEYADFLAKHQARRFSNISENTESHEKQALADEPLEAPSILDITSSFLESDSSSFPNVYPVPCPNQSLSNRTVPSTTDRGSISQPQRGCPQFGSYDLQETSQRLPSQTVLYMSAGEKNKHSSEPQVSDIQQSKLALCDIDIRDPTELSSQCTDTGVPFCPVSLDHVSHENVDLVTIEKGLTPSSISVSMGELAKGENLQQGSGQDDDQNLHLHHQKHQDLCLRPSIPEFVISDHSDVTDLVPEDSSDVPVFTLDETDVDKDLLASTPTSGRSGSPEYDLLDVGGRDLTRSLSVSSISSEASTCSTCTLLSDSEAEKTPPRKKQSSWRKIRSFILWSPFIQVFKKHRYPWIQLAGHQGNFHAGEAGSVLKKLDTREHACFQKLMADSLKQHVPEYRGDVDKNGETYIQLQDLLCSFNHPCVMDVKMGVRTYLEDELHKARRSPALRKDMYQKMMEIDTTAPTSEEHEQKAVTKPRYMQWRDEMSSSVELGFRVEGIKKSDGNSSKDFKKTKTRDNIVDILKSFVGDNENIVAKYIWKLKEIMRTQESSEFFQGHEVIGSSLLFVHDTEENVGVWMIDFGKTEALPKGVKIDHRSQWVEGNHEDGYLFGLDNLVTIFDEVQVSLTSSAV